MQLVVVGAHQRTAPVAIREQLAIGPDELPAALHKLSQLADEVFVLSTCNRVEIYATCSGSDGGRGLRQFLAHYHGLTLEELTPYLYTFVGEDAARHLFRVAAGLDSMALGEAQIMGQIKTSLQAAQDAGTLGALLNRLIHSALATGKHVRTATNLGRAQLSVVSVALQLARDTWGDFSGRSIVLIGAGRTAELTLKHLKSETVGALTVLSRTFERAADLATRYNGQARPLAELEHSLASADMVLSCTAAPDPIISFELAQRVLASRRDDIVLLDLAVPRDIERRVGTLPRVKLHDVDDLQAICDANRQSRAAEVASAEIIVDEHVQKFMHWWAAQEVLPTIRALRDHAEAIRQSELERTLARLAHLSEGEQQAVAALSTAIINKLLHHPITTLKQPQASDTLAQALQELFHLSTVRTLNGTADSEVN